MSRLSKSCLSKSYLSGAAARVGLTLGTAIGLASIALVAPTAEAATPTPPPTTIAAILAPYAGGFDTNNDDFTIPTHVLLQFHDLVVAATKPGNTTVFLPTDYAFRALIRNLTGNIVVPEDRLFAAVMRLGKARLGAVLRYHLVPGVRVSFGQLLHTNGFALPTLEGHTITVSAITVRTISGSWRTVVLHDPVPGLTDPKVVNADIAASNGIIHVIDRVMFPTKP
ncbi:MAG: fasciclin domain-containing protein [Actinomycetota bacterium]